MSHAFPVKTSPSLMPDDRNFGVRLVDGVLLVPEKFLPLLVKEKIETSDQLYAFINADPRAVAAAFDWSLEQVTKSRNGLRLIQGTIPPPPPSAPPPPHSKSSRPSFAPPPQYRPPSSLPPRPKPSFAPPPSMPPKKRNG